MRNHLREDIQFEQIEFLRSQYILQVPRRFCQNQQSFEVCRPTLIRCQLEVQEFQSLLL